MPGCKRDVARCPTGRMGQGGTLARVTGLEPATSGVTGRRSNQLSYTRNRGGAPSKASRPARQATCGSLRGMSGDGIEPPTLSV